MNCIENNFIGLKNNCLGNTESESGLYVNQIPGLNISMIEKITDAEVVQAQDLFNEIHDAAVKEVKMDFLDAMAEEFNFSSVSSVSVYGTHAEDFMPEEDLRVGIEIEKFDDHDVFTKPFINYISINLEEPVAGVVITLETNNNTITFTQDMTKGINKVFIEEYCDLVSRIYVDASNLKMSKNDISPNTNHNEGFYIRTYSETNGAINYYNTERSIAISVSNKCDTESFVCLYKQELAMPILYKIGMLLCTEFLISNRTNALVRNSKEEYAMILAELRGGVDSVTQFSHEGKYPLALERAVRMVKSSLSGVRSKCILCEQLKVVSRI
jgi:hypothetical protein